MFRLLAGRSDKQLPAGLKVYRSSILNVLTNTLAEELPVTKALLGTPDFRALVSAFLNGNDPDWDFSENLSGFVSWIAERPAFESVPFLPALAGLEAKIWQVQTLRGAPEQCAVTHEDIHGEVRLWQCIIPLIAGNRADDSDLSAVIANLDLDSFRTEISTHWSITFRDGKVSLSRIS